MARRGNVQPSNPQYTRTVELQTYPAKKVMHRVFARTAASLFRTDVVLRALESPTEVEKIDQGIEEILQTVRQELGKERERLEALREAHGIDFTPEYTSPSQEHVRIASPHVAGYLGLVLELDAVAQLTDSLWLSGILDNHQRSQAYHQWERRTERAGRKIIELERRAKRSSRRSAEREQGPKQSGQGNPSEATQQQDAIASPEDGSAEAPAPHPVGEEAASA